MCHLVIFIRTLWFPVLVFVICQKVLSVGSSKLGKFGSVKVSYDAPPLDYTWGRSWPEGIKLVDNFGSLGPRVRDETVLPSAPQNSRRLAPVKRTYDWQVDELNISFNRTALANPTCTRLEPPITWLAASGARVKVLHSVGVDKDEASSLIEISVARSFAESSLSVLRNKGFAREDIYRMLDKGPWVLAFDIPSSLPRLFASLQNDLGLSQSQSVHIVSHCPYLIAQYARYKGRDVFATAKVLLDIGYTLPKLVIDLMRFPSMLAAPPDRIRGWMALLEGFGVAKDPTLFGKMLKRAPFMFYVNPPKIGDDDLSYVVESDVSATASGFVAYGALKVLQLLKAQDFPDLDKIVRTQPSILLVDASEVSLRANFLFNLFQENLPVASVSGKGSVQGDMDAIYDPDVVKSKEKINISELEDYVNTAKTPSVKKRREDSYKSTREINSYTGNNKVEPFVQTSFAARDTSWEGNNLRSYERKSNNDQLGSYEEVSKPSLIPNQHQAHDLLVALLLTYPAVLSIDHQRMRDAGNALRSAGLKRGEVILLVRRHPPVLGRDPSLLINLLSFLKYNCGLHKADLLPFLYRYPAVLGAELKDIEPKVAYFFQSLGGSQETLRRFPSFLSYDLEAHTRPRAEFLRALKIDPLINGLPFLVNAPPKEIAYTAGVRVELFHQFQKAYGDMWKKKNTLLEKEKQKIAISSETDIKFKQDQFSSWIKEDNSPEGSLFDELDLCF